MPFGSKDREVTSESRRISAELRNEARQLAAILGRSNRFIKTIGIVGSVATEKAIPTSDLDLLCTIEDDSFVSKWSLDDIARSNGYAPDGKGPGRRVDIRVIEERIITNPDDPNMDRPGDIRRLDESQRKFLRNARRDQIVLYP